MASVPTVKQRKAEILHEMQSLREEASEAWSEVTPSLNLIDQTSSIITAAKASMNSPWLDLLRGRTFSALSKFAWREIQGKFTASFQPPVDQLPPRPKIYAIKD